ncbi:MAG: hypothetical protein N2053_05510, partial [Chitinispirillaceae bacterium]|nr:hypothetical protein [Chitinispirillaceae bacterium]
KSSKAKRVSFQSNEKLEIGADLFKEDEIIGIVVSEGFSLKYNKFLCVAIVKSKVASEKNSLTYKMSDGRIQTIYISKILG